MNGFRMPQTAITEQRALGWPDFHPEDWCHKCGRKNIVWSAPYEDWKIATEHEPRGEVTILCPQCFAQLHHENSSRRTVWMITPWESDHAIGAKTATAVEKTPPQDFSWNQD